MTGKMAGKLSNGSWNLVAEIGARLILFAIFMVLEYTPAFIRIIHEEEMWLYKNPNSEDTISTKLMFVISAVGPCVIFFILATVRKDNIDGIQAFLAFTLTIGLNGVVTNIIKVLVGRPRPDYFWRCYPNGVIPPTLKCDGNPDDIIEGRKSFPSGHSSFAFSGLGFLSLYLAGKLHCFQSQGRGQGWKLCVALVPVACALAVALTRYSDYRHHWQDITVGAMLGLFFSYLCYRQYYPALNRPHCHMPYCTVTPIKHTEEHDHLLPMIVREIKPVHPIPLKSL